MVKLLVSAQGIFCVLLYIIDVLLLGVRKLKKYLVPLLVKRDRLSFHLPFLWCLQQII